MAKNSSQPESLSYVAAARSDVRSRLGRVLGVGFLAGLVVFLLPAAAAVAVFFLAEHGRYGLAQQQFQIQAEYLADLIDPQAYRLPGLPVSPTDPGEAVLGAPLRKARKSFPAWSNLFVFRWNEDQIQVLLDTGDASETPRGERPAENITNLAGAMQGLSFSDSRSVLSPFSLLRQDDRVWSILVPLSASGESSSDFLYLETSLNPVIADLSLARDARDIALIAASILGLLTALIVSGWRYRSYLRQAVALNKVKESESLFRSTYEMSPVAMYLSELNGRIVRTNRAFCQFLGYDESELMRLRPSEYTRTLEAPGESVPASPSASRRQRELCFRRKDGRLVWGLVSTAIVRDAHNDISRILSQVVDITERKEVEEILRLSEERLALAADAGGVGMWDYDIETGAVVWNKVMHSIHKTNPESFAATFEGQRKFVVGEERGAFEDDFSRCMREGKPFLREYRVVDAVGETHHIKTRAIFIRNSAGKAVRAVGTAIDFSVEKAEAEELIRTREAALAADKAKSEFLAIMSHEIRTPLNGVLGFTSLLKGTPLNPEQLGYLETMEDSGGRLINLVNDILDLSKVEAGAIRIEPVTFAVRPFLKKIQEQFRLQAEGKKLKFRLMVAEDAPNAIHTDPDRLGQILTNLLGNAVKFTAAGHVHFHVKAFPKEENWEWHFAVKDTGPGISPELMPNLFQAFYQVDSSNTRRHGGTGLGLAISRRFAKRLKGQLVLRSEVDKGSEFTFILPSPKSELPQVESAKAVPTDPETKLAGKRILVVEDNALNRKLCGLQLKRLGCEIEYAEDGSAGVEKGVARGFDAILMDIQLPDIDGYEVTSRIRKSETTGMHVPIIAVTANAMIEDRRRCLDSGMDDFLSKPLKIDLLSETLLRWIGRKTTDGNG